MSRRRDTRDMAIANVLIIDDDPIVLDVLSDALKGLGHKVTCASTMKDGLRLAHAAFYDVVFLDVRLPDGNGLHALHGIRETPSLPEVIIMTGQGDPDGAELAIKSGAWDYIEKPASMKAMTLPLVRALQYREERKASSHLAVAARGVVALKREGIVGNSKKMTSCLDTLAQAASCDANVLISGETGTGKELFAWAVHNNSTRSDRKFIVVDCASLPEALVESLLFGHERGAFTGADRAQEGLIKQVDGGTLFLDEVGELPLATQKSFLRVLQERRFRPIGSKQELESDFRVVAATNRNIEEMVSKGEFRKDLLFRLRGFVIDLPPLRERKEDVKELVTYYVARFCEHYEMGMKGFSPEFFETLAAYDWPGNVRELLNALENALVAARHELTLFPRHLLPRIRIHAARASLGKKPQDQSHTTDKADTPEPLPTLRRFLEDMRLRYLQDLMSAAGSNVQMACRISGMSRAGLYAHLKKYDLLIP